MMENDINTETDETLEQTEEVVETTIEDNATIINTNEKAKDGQVKCPACGSTDISLHVKTGKLKCRYCKTEFEQEKLDSVTSDIANLEGDVIGSGAKNIQTDQGDTVTLKCTSCGAEVVVDTASSTQARCHWCRNTLSINNQLPNGAVPDSVLPFSVTKEEAQKKIEEFVGKRKFYANPKFKNEFTTANIMGVYFPYMLVDINAHSSMSGEGEIETRRYSVSVGDNKSETRYDADLYHVERDFDITINDLSVESSSDKLNKNSNEKTTNVINAIMPFDTENCVKYDSNYLKGYTSERRDVDIDQLKPIVEVQAKDIARHSANDTLTQYDRGVRWNSENLNIKGTQWISSYLPVWLYSYLEEKNGKKLLHYVAVNARTKETMGSVPIHMPKLLLVCAIIELVAIIGMIFVEWKYDFLFLIAGVIYYSIIYGKYRNKSARHTYEKETKNEMSNMKEIDNFINSEHGLKNSQIEGANNKRVEGSNVGNNILSKFTQK